VTLQQWHYERLLYFRTGLRQFLRWSAEQATAAGLTPARHQLLLAVRGHPDPSGPTIADVARHLLIRHHSVVELVDRAVTAGLVERRKDADDWRAVRRRLTADGADRLARLSALHLEELRRFAPQLEALWEGLNTLIDAPADPCAAGSLASPDDRSPPRR
jgi:DNA-binding MarR family transcriptional regulator